MSSFIILTTPYIEKKNWTKFFPNYTQCNLKKIQIILDRLGFYHRIKRERKKNLFMLVKFRTNRTQKLLLVVDFFLWRYKKCSREKQKSWKKGFWQFSSNFLLCSTLSEQPQTEKLLLQQKKLENKRCSLIKYQPKFRKYVIQKATFSNGLIYDEKLGYNMSYFSLKVRYHNQESFSTLVSNKTLTNFIMLMISMHRNNYRVSGKYIKIVR